MLGNVNELRIEPLFRPPSEARSLIFQVTNGCSWNNCTFCEMYTAPQKKFSVKTAEEITQELQQIVASDVPIRRVFLADGDAMTLSFRRLKEVLLLVRQYLPDVQRVSSYCLPRNLKNKTVEQLTELEQLGLKLMYVGCESGDDRVLEKVAKGRRLSILFRGTNKNQTVWYEKFCNDPQRFRWETVLGAACH